MHKSKAAYTGINLITGGVLDTPEKEQMAVCDSAAR